MGFSIPAGSISSSNHTVPGLPAISTSKVPILMNSHSNYQQARPGRSSHNFNNHHPEVTITIMQPMEVHPIPHEAYFNTTITTQPNNNSFSNHVTPQLGPHLREDDMGRRVVQAGTLDVVALHLLSFCLTLSGSYVVFFLFFFTSFSFGFPGFLSSPTDMITRPIACI
jgi:hypothetical protein